MTGVTTHVSNQFDGARDLVGGIDLKDWAYMLLL